MPAKQCRPSLALRVGVIEIRAHGSKRPSLALRVGEAAARNEALSDATGDYAFWLDADEVVEPAERVKRSLAGSAPTDWIVCKLFALIARTHQIMGDSQSALATCAKGLELMPEDAELWFRKGIVHRHRGESSEAERCWRLIFTLAHTDQFRSVDPGIYGHLTRRNLAAVAAERGDYAEVQQLWEAVLAECPGDREATGETRATQPDSFTVRSSH
jgi:glycosyltransferase involved in cell wall biosynthesis